VKCYPQVLRTEAGFPPIESKWKLPLHQVKLFRIPSPSTSPVSLPPNMAKRENVILLEKLLGEESLPFFFSPFSTYAVSFLFNEGCFSLRSFSSTEGLLFLLFVPLSKKHLFLRSLGLLSCLPGCNPSTDALLFLSQLIETVSLLRPGEQVLPIKMYSPILALRWPSFSPGLPILGFRRRRVVSLFSLAYRRVLPSSPFYQDFSLNRRRPCAGR